MSEGHEHVDEVVQDIKIYTVAMEMFLAGYQQRVEDEKKQPSSLRDREDFRQHVRKQFERSWSEYGPVRGESA